MRKAFFAGIVAVCWAGIVAVAGDPRDRHHEKIAAAVDSAFTEMVSYAEKLDYDRLNTGVDDRCRAGFIVNNHYYADYESLIAVLKPAAEGVSGQQITFSHKKITVLTDDVVLLAATGVSDVSLADGRRFQTNFYWSFVYRNVDGKWKVVQSHQSASK